MLDPATDIRFNADKAISSTGPCFIIAEIGQNHQGNFNMAKKLIRIAKVRHHKRPYLYLYTPHPTPTLSGKSKDKAGKGSTQSDCQ